MIASDLTALLVCYEHNDNSPQQVMLRVLGTLVLLYQVKPLFEGVFSSSTCYPSPPLPPGCCCHGTKACAVCLSACSLVCIGDQQHDNEPSA